MPASQVETAGQPDSSGTPGSAPPPSPAQQATPLTPHHFAIAVCGIGLTACFFSPWVTFDQNISGATLFRLGGFGRVFWIIPVLALATVVLRQNKTYLRNLGTAAPVLTWLAVWLLLLNALKYGIPSFRWGGSLSLLFSLALFALSGEGRLTAPLDFVARKFSSRKGEQFEHSGSLMPNVHFSSKEFYEKIEVEVVAKKWPGVQVLRVNYSEAGVLSHKREYLRIIRKQQCFDVCAAAFGVDYFFSLRAVEIPAVVTYRTLLAVVLGLFVLTVMIIQFLGFILGVFAAFFLFCFGVWFLFNILKMGLTKLDALLMQMPVFNAVYLAWFRKETYFEQDSRIIFLQSVKGLVEKHVDDAISAKGIRFLDSFERAPLLGALYKKSRLKLGGDGEPVAD